MANSMVYSTMTSPSLVGSTSSIIATGDGSCNTHLSFPRLLHRSSSRNLRMVLRTRSVTAFHSSGIRTPEVEGTSARNGIWSIRDDLQMPSSPYFPVEAQGDQGPSPMVIERFQGVISQLFQHRIIRCGGAVDDDMANIIVAQLLYLDAVDPTKDIVMYVNSPGGSVTAGMAIFDTIRHIRPSVSTVCVGLAASMGAFILSSGTKGKRYSLPPPEVEIYCYLLCLIYLIDQKCYVQAKACSTAGINRIKNMNRRTVDVLASKLYFYYSLSYEHTNSLSEIRGNLLSLHRMATLHHDELGQETLLNLLLRNYLHYNLYDQAEKLRSKAPRFEAHSNQQFCRYLFYLGKIRTIQLEYTDAKESLLQASRKAPTAARGFKIMCNKWAVIVRLLLGEIPERTIFMQNGMKKALVPYFELTNAVRIGDLELFRTATEKCSNVFSKDGTHNLIVRLRHNVIRTGLRNISISYSRISLIDVAKKLRLDSDNPVADAESIVAKAIRDGAIDATLDHTNGWMVSKETGDIYSTNEPQLAFNSRIAFCLNMHNEAVRALRFPPNSQKDKESAENRRERQQQEQELAKHLAEEDEF